MRGCVKLNREIKFRAWLKKKKKMVVVNDLTFNKLESEPVGVNDCGNDDCTTCIDWYQWEDVEIMKYINKNDADENEIYENFIIQIVLERYVFGYYQESIYTGVVKFDEEELCFYVELLNHPEHGGEEIPNEVDGIPIYNDSFDEPSNKFYFGEEVTGDSIKILGNIYENPELLKEV